MDKNPWQVTSIEVFRFTGLKCPECPFFAKEENIFQSHATKNHPLSSVLFGNSSFQVKNEKNVISKL